MIELRRLKEKEVLPRDEEVWVLVEKRGDLFFVSAKSKDGPIDTSLAGNVGVDSDRIAIKGAELLADLLGVEVIYVRDDH